jgi:competence protein ComEA
MGGPVAAGTGAPPWPLGHTGGGAGHGTSGGNAPLPEAAVSDRARSDQALPRRSPSAGGDATGDGATDHRFAGDGSAGDRSAGNGSAGHRPAGGGSDLPPDVLAVVVDAATGSVATAAHAPLAAFPGLPTEADHGGSGVRTTRERVGRLIERWLPGGLLTDRGRPGVVALSAIAAAAALAAAAGVWLNRPVVEPAPALPLVAAGQAAQRSATAGGSARSAASAADAPAGTGGERGQILVSVVGKVARPGLVTLPEGARVADAVQAAGGAVPGTDLATLNLARRLTDGEQVAVGVPAAAPAVAGPDAAPGAPAEKVDLNAATVAQLDALPGVGPVTAQRIVEWRTRHGRFARVDQLREVDGIGGGRFDRLKELVRV